MAAEATTRAEAQNEFSEADDGNRKRAKSGIMFPYSDLGMAIELVRTLDQKVAGQCSTIQLAAWLSLSVNGGTFRSRYSGARMFGLIKPEQGGRVRITDLGKEILSAQAGDRARATAFLKVPLYQRIYDQRQGQPLPASDALERMAIELGVPPKQVRRARQAFFRSAEVAQFIDENTGNFAHPGFSDKDHSDSTEQRPLAETPVHKPDGGGAKKDDAFPKIDPIIMGLIGRLPESGSEWPLDERKLWLGILESTFRLVYKDSEEESVATVNH